MQILLAGFCLMTRDVHAAAISSMSEIQADAMAGLCGKSEMHHAQPPTGHHGSGCFHCDRQTPLIQSASATALADMPVFSPLLALVALVSEPVQRTMAASVSMPDMATAPPRSSTLLFTTTQRIRV